MLTDKIFKIIHCVPLCCVFLQDKKTLIQAKCTACFMTQSSFLYVCCTQIGRWIHFLACVSLMSKVYYNFFPWVPKIKLGPCNLSLQAASKKLLYDPSSPSHLKRWLLGYIFSPKKAFEATFYRGPQVNRAFAIPHCFCWCSPFSLQAFGKRDFSHF